MVRYRFFVLLLVLIPTMLFAQKTIRSISFAGLENEREKTLLSMMSMEQGDVYDASLISQTVRQLYRSGRFRTVDLLTMNDDGSAVDIRIEVVENPYLEDVEVRGNRKVGKTKIRELVDLQAGERISDAKIHAIIVKLRREYEEKGYLNVNIQCDLISTKMPGFVIARFTVDEGDKIRVEEITFEGNNAFTDKKLRRKFKTKKRHMFSSGEYNPDVYLQHLDSLLLFYSEEGYMDARIMEDSVTMNSDSTGLAIDVVVDEGEQYFVGDFYFVDNDIIETPVLESAVMMTRGKPFSRTDFLMSRQMVGTVYRNEGYLWAEVEPKYKYRGDTIDVVFTVNEGRPAIVRKINIAGNEKTREQVIRRELRIYPGQKYDQSALERSIRDVQQLNYFDNVLPDISMNPDGTVDLDFTVEEKANIGQFSAGITYSDQDKFGGNFGISIPNFRGAGEQLDATIDIAQGRKRYSVGFMKPWMFNTPTSFSVQIFYEDVDYTNDYYDYERLGIEYGVGRRLKWPDDYFSVSFRHLLSYDYNQTNYVGIQDSLGIDVVNRGLLSRWYLGLVRNDTDYPQFPTQGSIFRIAGYLGGINGRYIHRSDGDTLQTYSYVKSEVSYDWYSPLFWKFVLGAKAKFGMIGSFSDRPVIGYSDLFQVGGVYYDGIVRGYDEGEIGINLNMLTLSAELRFPIIDQQFYMAGFFDMGNSWNKVNQIDMTDMKKGTGFGFRLMLPMVGLLGFDFAWGLDDPHSVYYNDDKYSEFKLHFIMNRGF